MYTYKLDKLAHTMKLGEVSGKDTSLRWPRKSVLGLEILFSVDISEVDGKALGFEGHASGL